MPQWFVSFEPSTRARTFMGSVKKNVSYTKLLHCLRNDSYRKPSGKIVSLRCVPQNQENGKGQIVDLLAHRWPAGYCYCLGINSNGFS